MSSKPGRRWYSLRAVNVLSLIIVFLLIVALGDIFSALVAAIWGARA